jgi:phenylacetate-coenzyme A ligase PaaK-like adenylate-forming protein
MPIFAFISLKLQNNSVSDLQDIRKRIFSVGGTDEFNALCLDIFRYQAAENDVYRQYVELLKVVPAHVQSIEDIPFLPIDFFKTRRIVSGTGTPQITFLSSGTTGMTQSQHQVLALDLYEESFRKAFALFYGDVKNYCVLALLPSYLAREGSSLIYMANDLIEKSEHAESGFYLNQLDELKTKLNALSKAKQPTILLGVTYALLDLAEAGDLDLPHTVVMETGGMKGMRKEMVREELHALLTKGLGVNTIHSEYGMTELLSQAYSKGHGIFECPPWMKVFTREINDPFNYTGPEKTGGINVIDLANLHSCSFIATQDLARVQQDGSFEILGRFDNSDLRGCNLLVI